MRGRGRISGRTRLLPSISRLEEVPEHEARRGRVRERRPDHLDAGGAGSAPAVSEPEGHHLADHGRDRRSGSSARRAAIPRQGEAHGSRHAELAPQVRQGRHHRRLRALEPG